MNEPGQLQNSGLSTFSSTELLRYTLEKLKNNLATRRIPDRLKDPAYDTQRGAEICQLMFSLCHNDLAEYGVALKDFIDFSEEFLRLQMELERTGKYHFSSYSEAKKNIYDNPEVMERRYLQGLLLSQALWINQHKILNFFISEFCINNFQGGRMVEVPVGTGIFIAEFMQRNLSWQAEGYDISSSAIAMAKRTVTFKVPQAPIQLEKKDVFDIQEKKPYHRIVCGLLLENMENPALLLRQLQKILSAEGMIFLTASVWASTIDHLYLFKSVKEIQTMIRAYFDIEKELVLNVFPERTPEEEKTPLNYACILKHKSLEHK